MPVQAINPISVKYVWGRKLPLGGNRRAACSS
jgi:hypothetical protein